MPRDEARDWTDGELESLERRIRREYAQAAKEMRSKQKQWLKDFNREREQREKALDGTKEAAEAHKRWLESQAARSDWMHEMVDGLSRSATEANQKAVDMVNGFTPKCFAENANRAAFNIDKAVKVDTGFTLVNEDAVRYLMGAGEANSQLVQEVVDDTPKLGPADVQHLRKRELDYPKDMRWNRQKFTSAITQGILQGESIPNIVKRTDSVFGMNRNSAIRAARTSTTNAENAGRMNSFERAQRLGIDMEIEWLATLDERTRSSHRRLDGKRIQLGEYFEGERGRIRWPGDPQAHPAEVWNCRCRADGEVVGFDGKRGDWADEPSQRWSRLPDGLTYEQWKDGVRAKRNSERIIESIELREKTALDILDYNRDTGLQPLHSKDDREICTEETFFQETIATFTPVEKPKGKASYVSPSGSQYWYTPEGVIRYSDHWGSNVATCSWFLEGKNELRAYTTNRWGLAETFGSNQNNSSRLWFEESYGFCRWEDFVKKSDVIGGVDDGEFMALKSSALRAVDDIVRAGDTRTVEMVSSGTPIELATRDGFSMERFTSQKGNEMIRLKLPNGSDRVIPLDKANDVVDIKWRETEAWSKADELATLDSTTKDAVLALYRNGELPQKSELAIRSALFDSRS